MLREKLQQFKLTNIHTLSPLISVAEPDPDPDPDPGLKK
jgi:hypothetical protein